KRGKPTTFADICAIVDEEVTRAPGTIVCVPSEGSLRRALDEMVEDNPQARLLAMGGGGPGDPVRYFLHPVMLGGIEEMVSTDWECLEHEALQAALWADPGAQEAMDKWTAANADSIVEEGEERVH